MHKEKRIAAAFDGAGVKESAELTIPEKEFNAGNVSVIKNYFFWMNIELVIQAIKFGDDEYQHEDYRYQPFPAEQLFPLLGDDELANYRTANRNNSEHSFSHDGAGGKNTAP